MLPYNWTMKTSKDSLFFYVSATKIFRSLALTLFFSPCTSVSQFTMQRTKKCQGCRAGIVFNAGFQPKQNCLANPPSWCGGLFLFRRQYIGEELLMHTEVFSDRIDPKYSCYKSQILMEQFLGILGFKQVLLEIKTKTFPLQYINCNKILQPFTNAWES